jgi:PII-like signaling protein
VIDIIDSMEYIEKLMPFLDEVVQEGLITIEDIEIIKYTLKPRT